MTDSTQPPSKPRFAVRLVGYLLMLVFIAGSLEIAARAYYYLRDGAYIPINARLDTGLGNIIAATNSKGKSEGCRWIDAIFPHPYLGYVVHQENYCPARWPNAQGLIGRDFPTEKSNESFNILLTGGSVAMFLGQYFPDKPIYLEDALNKCYIPPKGTSFKVYNGAMGGYRYPQEEIVFQLFGRAFDGLVTFEGANEYHSVLRIGGPYGGPNGRFETVNTDFSEIVSSRTDNYKLLATIYLENKLLSVAKRSRLVTHSFLAYFVIDHVASYLQNQANTATETQKKEHKTTVETLLSLPKDWEHDKVVWYNFDQYKWHLRNLHAMAKAQGIPSITFFQPVPSYYKTLSEEEKKVYGGNAHDYKPLPYLTMIDELMKLRDSNQLPLYSLVDVFKDRKETIYADPIHYEIEGVFPDSKFHNSGVPATGRSLGYELVAEAMAPKIAETFGFKSKCQPEMPH